MYVTRPLSQYLRSPESLSIPPEGPSSGYLVIQDEEPETTNCYGLCKLKNTRLRDLPSPQNKNLTVTKMHARTYVGRAGYSVSLYEAAFIPVLNQPLSSNRYYVIKAKGSRKGEAYACSREKDMTDDCFTKVVQDGHPRPLDPSDIYQQFEIVPYRREFSSKYSAKSVAPDGFPPYFFRKSDRWTIFTTTPKTYELGEALGINTALRGHLPDFDSPLIVGKWYCPFMFVKEGNLRDQMKRSLFYEMTLERRWENIFSCENSLSTRGNSVSVETEVQREVVVVRGMEAVWDENTVVDGVVWFKRFVGVEVPIGLSSLIVDRMKWEEERGGWVREEKRKVRVERTEDFGGIGGGWSKFGCYVLVERFVLKRMDESNHCVNL